MSTFTFTAETGDLCRALAAAEPFANSKLPSFSTVRLFVDEANIYVGATNGNALGLALASCFALESINSDGEAQNTAGALFEVDLLPAQCKAIVALFKAGAAEDSDDGEPGAELRIEVGEEEVIITDASGLLEGQSLTLPRPPTVANAAAVIVSVESLNVKGPDPASDRPPRYYPASLALVLKAAKVYGHDLTFEHRAPAAQNRSGSTLVRCGESFLAVLVDAWLDEDVAGTRDRWAGAWGDRLAPLRDRALAFTNNDPKEN
ncbi:hypothetical protein [Janibacter sp. GS2]|uniref:hypothetical protein n=1 Tax=Janibacter sp. GS2 TaxID=3442646 RepID=UPI003EBCAB53